MKYRIKIDISFENEIDAQNLLDYINNIKNNTYIPTGNELSNLYQKAEYGYDDYMDIDMSIIDEVQFG